MKLTTTLDIAPAAFRARSPRPSAAPRSPSTSWPRVARLAPALALVVLLDVRCDQRGRTLRHVPEPVLPLWPTALLGVVGHSSLQRRFPNSWEPQRYATTIPPKAIAHAMTAEPVRSPRSN